MLRDAGVEVVTGVLEQECLRLNRRFITAHTYHRPFVTLKWAQSADGYLDRNRSATEPPEKFSKILGTTLVHRIRSLHDAITVGSGTIIADKPHLDTRYWSGRTPIKIINDRSISLPTDYDATIMHEPTVESFLNELYQRNITSLLVEGGATLLRSFIDSQLWDDIRIEVTPKQLGNNGSTKAPVLNSCDNIITPNSVEQLGNNIVLHYTNHNYIAVKNL
jgi:diaminohydroxyphosphoribosylaminopyrimidine deaminase/5-amino-6-(5-phosphoribosylamino)uracil reductase